MHSLTEAGLHYCLGRLPADAARTAVTFLETAGAGTADSRLSLGAVSRLVEACLGMYYRRCAGVPLSPRFLDFIDRAAIEVASLEMASHAVHGLLRTTQYSAMGALAAWAKQSDGAEAQGLSLAVDEWEQTVVYVQEFFRSSRGSDARSTNGPSADRLIGALVSSDGADRESCNALAAHLGGSALGRWVVAVGVTTAGDDLNREAARLRSIETPAHYFEQGPWPVLIAELPAEQSTLPNDWLRNVTCGYVIAHDMSGVPASISLARIVSSSLPAGAKGRWSVRDGWLQVVLWSLGDFGDHLLRDVMGEAVLSEGFPGELLETALTFLRTGSVAETAELLFVHRNTVLYRLRQTKNLLALDWSRPHDCALLLVALKVLEERAQPPKPVPTGLGDAQHRPVVVPPRP